MILPIDIFLKRNNLYNKFIEGIKCNHINFSHEDAIKHYNKEKSSHHRLFNLIASMFIWANTPQGTFYWDGVEHDYINFLDKIGDYLKDKG